MTRRRRSEALVDVAVTAASAAMVALAAIGCHRASTPSPISNQVAIGDKRVTSAIPPLQAALLDAYGLPPPSHESLREVELLKQHHADEERDRRLRFDQRKIEDHRAVVALLANVRSSYDAARSKGAIARAKSRFAPLLLAMKERAAGIDPWGNNSNVAADYGPLLDALANEYPAAAVASLDGNGTSLAALRARLDDRTAKMTELLRLAEQVEPE